MIAIRKKIVWDEELGKPVEVIIAWNDWLEIERLLGLEPTDEERLTAEIKESLSRERDQTE